MRSEVARDLSDSSFDFLRVVVPTIRHRIGGGRVESVEITTERGMKDDLDLLAGIDAWQMVHQQGVMRGIASRVQWGYDYRSFTIRTDRPNGSRTEREKRLAAIDDPDRGWLLPHLTVQAYVEEPKRKGNLISVGIVRTRDLFDCVKNHRPNGHKSAGNGGEEFDFYTFPYLKWLGYRVEVISQRSDAVDFMESQ